MDSYSLISKSIKLRTNVLTSFSYISTLLLNPRRTQSKFRTNVLSPRTLVRNSNQLEIDLSGNDGVKVVRGVEII